MNKATYRRRAIAGRFARPLLLRSRRHPARTVALPQAGHAQGIVRGAQEGSYEGNRVAGPVGGVVGGAVGAGVGGAVGAVEGRVRDSAASRHRCRGYYVPATIAIHCYQVMRPVDSGSREARPGIATRQFFSR